MRRSAVVVMLIAAMLMALLLAGCSSEESTLESDTVSPDAPMNQDDWTAQPASGTSDAQTDSGAGSSSDTTSGQ